MGLKRASFKKRRPYINIVPLIDVLTILIFFFLLTMEFGQVSHLNITPPKIETAEKSGQTATITLGIMANGEYVLNEVMIKDTDLKKDLAEFLQKTSDRAVILYVDEQTPVRYLTHAMDMCTAAGARQVKLQSR